MNLNELIEWAGRARGQRPPPERIRVARDLYERLRTEAHERLAYPTASVAATAYGIPIVVDDELPPGEHRVDESRWSS